MNMETVRLMYSNSREQILYKALSLRNDRDPPSNILSIMAWTLYIYVLKLLME